MKRHFLFLQGPHGAMFPQLAHALLGARVGISRIGLNAADAAEWRGLPGIEIYTRAPTALDAALNAHIDRHAATDVVIYGDARPLHSTAARIARLRGLTLHCFEEGYLRPHWVTYERGGVNGGSRLMSLSLADMRAALPPAETPLRAVPDQWGTVLGHSLNGAFYHARLALSRQGHATGMPPHREIGVWREAMLALRKVALMPLTTLDRRVRTAGLLRSGAPFDLALLQLGHDASLRAHSDFTSMRAFVEAVTAAFAAGAPAHQRLVFKTHPFEDGREPLRRIVRAAAAAQGIEGRVHFITGGKLGPLMDRARSAVTVNSTAAQQALWRALPVRALGRAVFARDGLVSDQPLAAFFAHPQPPDFEAYLAFRRFLLLTSQLKGSFYTASGRANIVRAVLPMVLARADPYDAVLDGALRRGAVDASADHSGRARA